MVIIYISTSCPICDVNIINSKLNKKLQVSSNKYHNSLINGLVSNNVYVNSIYALPVNNKVSKKIFWKNAIKTGKNVNYYQLGFINIPLIKYLTINYNLKKTIKRIINNSSDERFIIIFDGAFVSIYPTIKKFLKTIDTYAVIADVYEYMADIQSKKTIKSFFYSIVKKYIKKINKDINGFIFLNENMNDLYKSKNYIVVEGIDYYNNKLVFNDYKIQKKVLLYAGGLLEKFGIINLINAFKRIDNDSLELHLYGYTDIEDYIESLIKNDHRIKYFGMQSPELVFMEEQKAFLLVNPRPIDNEFQKYSFPSKIIEYMSSGRPVLTTKVDGTPKEYDKYLYYFDDYSVDGLKKRIEEVVALNHVILDKKGKEAYTFIHNNKNAKMQAKKVLGLVSRE